MKLKQKRIWGMLAFMCFFTASLWSQVETAYLTEERLVNLSKTIGLGGKASVVILSSHGDLAVRTNDPADVVKVNKNADGKFEYEVLIDLSKSKERLFTANRDVLKTTFKELLEPNTRIYYSVEEVDVPITLHDQTKRIGLHPVADEAAIEFNSAIENLQVQHDKGLDCIVKRTKSDTGTQIVTAIIKIKPYLELIKKCEGLKTEYARIDAKYLSEGQSLSSEELDVMDEKMSHLKAEVESLQETINNLSTLTVYGDRTNKLSVSIRDIGIKQKKSYSILLLKEEVKVFESEYTQLLSSAEQAEENRKFKTARDFYEQAANSEMVPEEAKETLKRKIQEMEECDMHLTKATRSMAYIGVLRKENNEAKIQEVEDHFRNARISYENLYKLRGSDLFYKNIIDRIDKQLEKMNFYVIEGSVRAKSGGARIDGVSIYAIPRWVTSKRDEKKYRKEIGQTDSDGNFRVEVNRDAEYKELLFVPENNKEYSNSATLPMPKKHLKTTVYLFK